MPSPCIHPSLMPWRTVLAVPLTQKSRMRTRGRCMWCHKFCRAFLVNLSSIGCYMTGSEGLVERLHYLGRKSMMLRRRQEPQIVPCCWGVQRQQTLAELSARHTLPFQAHPRCSCIGSCKEIGHMRIPRRLFPSYRRRYVRGVIRHRMDWFCSLPNSSSIEVDSRKSWNL